MAQWHKILIKTLFAIAMTCLSIYLFAPWEFALHYLRPLPESIEQEIAQASDTGIDGIIVYTNNASNETKLYADGWHNRQTGIPAKSSALFKIASIAKLYDAAAVAKLVASDTLNLDQTLQDYLPEFAQHIQYSDQITLRMLVQHRSGIPNFVDQEGFNWGERDLNAFDLVKGKPADFKPGEDYGYSNTNYLLLQEIMNAVLGYPYSHFIKNEMLAPLGLNQTYFSVNEVDQDNLMSGYHVGYEEDLKSLDQGYVATAEDVGIFLKALNKGTLLTRKEQEIYSTIYEFEHTGWVLGYSSIARYHKDIDTVVIQFTSTTGNDTVLLTKIVYGRIMKILRKKS